MGVYTKGMEMPASCPCELLGIGYDLYCSFAGGIPARVKEYYECCQNGTRPSWCPLVPISQHGRLIDADEFYEALTMDDHVSIIEAIHVKSILSEVPTVIPAEEGE